MKASLSLFWLRFRYLVKSLLPRWAELRIRQAIAQHKLATVHDVWPILESAGNPPHGWAGWPMGKQFSLILSHDVDTQLGAERCLKIAEIEERLGFRSAFYFVPKGRYDDPASLRKKLVQRGFEVKRLVEQEFFNLRVFNGALLLVKQRHFLRDDIDGHNFVVLC